MKILVHTALLLAATIALTTTAFAATPQQVCQARKNRAVARYTSCTLRAEAALSKVSYAHDCRPNFEKRWKVIVRRASRQNAQCFDAPATNKNFKSYIRSSIKEIMTLLGRRVRNLRPAQRECRDRKAIEAGRYAACRHRAEETFARDANVSAYDQRINRCEADFNNEWQEIIDETAESGTICYDNSRSAADYKEMVDSQTRKVAGVLAGTDLFNPIAISVSGTPLTLNAGGVAGTLTVTNSSSKGIATGIDADFSGTALEGNVTVTGNTCSQVAPGASCSLTLTTANSVVSMTSFRIKGDNTTEIDAVLTIPAPPATLSMTGSPLSLTTGSSSGVISITNTSTITTAANIKATFTGTALAGNVTETANTCTSVAPGTGCTITFTPGNSVVAQTDFTIQGDNTNTLSAAISIATPPPTTATISLSGSPLHLEANGATDVLTVSNTSLTVTALNITSNFTGTALDGNVTETGNTCASVAPGASCTLTFTPGSTVVAPTSFPIEGTNTNSLTASIEIISGTTLTNVSPNSGSASGGTGVTLTGTGLTGTTSVTFGGVAATAVNVVNSTTVTAVAPAHAVGAVDVVVTTPAGGATLTNGYTFITTTVGQSAHGGTIACLNGGLQDLIAASADNSTSIVWGGIGVTTGATSNTDGASNTVTVVAALGAGTYAAQTCNDYEIDSQGNTPCQAGNTCYNDWFLAALDQLNCTYTNRVAIGGFSNGVYWSSTEFDSANSMVQVFASGAQGIGGKNNALSTRCVRAFVP